MVSNNFWLLHHLTWMRDRAVVLILEHIPIVSFLEFVYFFPRLIFVLEHLRWNVCFLNHEAFSKQKMQRKKNKDEWRKWNESTHEKEQSELNVMCDYKLWWTSDPHNHSSSAVIFNYLILSTNFLCVYFFPFLLT